MNLKIRSILLFGIVLNNIKLHAANNDFQLRGFANFGFSYTELKPLDAGTKKTDRDYTISGKKSPDVQNRYRDGIQILDKTELGLNLYFPMSQNTEFRSQIVANGRNLSMSFLNLDWGYLLINTSQNSQIVIGRQIAPTWKNSRYVDVEAALTLRYTPDLTDIYPVKSFDGISYNYKTDIGAKGILSLSTGFGANWFHYKDIDYNILRSLYPVLTNQDRGGKNQLNLIYVSADYEWESLFWHTYASFNTVNSNLYGLTNYPFMMAASALIWESETLLVEAEAGYILGLDSQKDVDKRTEKKLTELKNKFNEEFAASAGNFNENQIKEIASYATKAQLAYLTQNLMSYQILVGYHISESLLPYIAYSQQIPFDDEAPTRVGIHDMNELQFAETLVKLTRNLFGMDVKSITAGLNINLSESVITKINYIYKNFGNPQYKDGKNVSKTDYKTNGILQTTNNNIPRDEDVHIFSVTLGNTF